MMQNERILKGIGIRVKEKVRVDLFLKEGVSDKDSHATYITLCICEGRKRTPIHLNKPKAAQLSLMLNQLVAEGSNVDYERLRKKYPNQDTWHIY